MSIKIFIDRLLDLMKYIYNNLHYLDYDERQELLMLLNYWRDKIVLNKFDLTK